MSDRSPQPDPPVDQDELDGDAYDAFLDALDEGDAPSVSDFVKEWPGVSEELVERLTRLAGASAGRELPERIGPYEILGELGRGGMGVVFLARDPSLDREVAVKVLGGARRPSQERIDRLAREARTLASLDHRGIATVFAFDAAEDGQPYIVMERVEGADLAKHLRKGALSWRETLRVLLEIASALAAAHGRGIVHRDLKPSNVMISTAREVRLLDFGLSASAGETVRGSDGSSVHGTPGYMSPEQRRGESHDARDDVWALGRIGAECLMGTREIPEPLPEAPPGDAPLALWRVLRACTNEAAAERPVDGAAAHAALRGAEAMLGPGASGGVRLAPRGARFIGRAQELGQLRELLSESGCATVTGPGGVGKSRLAHELAREHPRPAWVELVRGGADDVSAAILAALGARQNPGEEPAEALQRAASSVEPPLLVVLDNAEHVRAAAAEAVRALLAGAPELRVLVTSRTPLGIEGERVLRLPPLDAEEAARLFVDRARGAGLAPADDGADVERICRAVDALPLSIELAAARAPLVGLDALAGRLERSDDLASDSLLVAAGEPLDPRHRGLAELVRWSLDLLSEEERRAFRRLGAFEAGWTLEAAEDVLTSRQLPREDVLPLIARLVEHSLAVRDHGRGGWTFLELLRQAARNELAASDDEDAARSRHGEHHIARAEEAVRAGNGPERAAAFVSLEDETPELYAAMAFVSQAGHPDLAGRAYRLSGALFEFWISRGRLAEGLRVHEATMAGAYEATGSEQAQAHVTHATILGRMGRRDEGFAALERARALAVEVGDRDLEAIAIRNVGYFEMQLGRLDEARVHYEESLVLTRASGDGLRVGNLLNDLGVLALYAGEFTRAADLYTESLVLRRAAGDLWGEASSLGNLGEVHHRLGDHVRARQELATSLALFQDLGDLRSVAESFEMSAALEISSDQPERATLLSGAAEGLRERFGFPIPPVEQGPYAEDQRAMESALGAERYRALRAEGAALPADTAIALALEEPEGA